MECTVVVASHSGYGHTLKLAEAVVSGAAQVEQVSAVLVDVASMDEATWRTLDQADAIVFGSPTYMGSVSGSFKQFADESAKVWFTQGWKDKLAGGFTCSMSMSGDKFSTLSYLVTLAMQHGMIWIGAAQMPASEPGDPDSVNRLGAYIGVMGQADNVPADQSPPAGDVESARLYGERIAQMARRLAQVK